MHNKVFTLNYVLLMTNLVISFLPFLIVNIRYTNSECNCAIPCSSTVEKINSCPAGRTAPRKDCDCCQVCLGQVDSPCREPDLPCDTEEGLVCAPKTNGYCQECGVNQRSGPLVAKIFGGQDANPKDWPWMAALIKAYSRESAFCGAVLLSDQYVLTAAHCIKLSMDEIRVRLGEYDFSKPNENSHVDFELEKIIKHPSFIPATFENDIALLQLKTPTTFNEYIWPTCLPPSNDKFENQIAIATGWGAKVFLGAPSNVLQEVPLKVWPQTDCVDAYPNKFVSDRMICSGWISGEGDSCQGDSGGPLMLQDELASRWFVIGLVSWGEKCGTANHPGVYTRVNSYTDWIKFHMHTQTADVAKPPNVPPPVVVDSPSSQGGRAFDCSEACLSAGNCKSGVYTIYPKQDQAVEVFCDMTTEGGGWTVLVNRMKTNHQEEFERNWNDYKKGFGNATAEYWIGNDILHAMTSARDYTLRIEAKAKGLEDIWGEFRTFKVDSEELNYRLTLEEPTNGNIVLDGASGLSQHNGMAFTTADRDNDLSWGNCGSLYGAGMWYNRCYSVFFTGKYGVDKPNGIRFESWSKSNPVIAYATTLQLKIRPRSL